MRNGVKRRERGQSDRCKEFRRIWRRRQELASASHSPSGTSHTSTGNPAQSSIIASTTAIISAPSRTRLRPCVRGSLTNFNIDPNISLVLAIQRSSTTASPGARGFVGWCLAQDGIDGTGSLMATSYLRWGEALDVPRKGCVVVMQRGTDPATGPCVGFFHSKAGSRVMLLAGNQGDKVSLVGFPGSMVLSYRWPSGIEAPALKSRIVATFEGRRARRGWRRGWRYRALSQRRRGLRRSNSPVGQILRTARLHPRDAGGCGWLRHGQAIPPAGPRIREGCPMDDRLDNLSELSAPAVGGAGLGRVGRSRRKQPL